MRKAGGQGKKKGGIGKRWINHLSIDQYLCPPDRTFARKSKQRETLWGSRNPLKWIKPAASTEVGGQRFVWLERDFT